MILFEDVDRLQAIVRAVRQSPYANFYRDTLTELPEAVQSIEQLPFLTRAELVAVPPDERCYVAPKDVAFVAYTSGTSNGKPLVTFFSEVARYHVDPAWGTDVNRLLVVFPPLNKNFCGTFIQQCREIEPSVTPVFGDPANLPASAYLGSMLQVDALYATPSLAFALAPHLAQVNVHTRIKLLAISGETMTNEQRVSLQALYPNAVIANLYASSEIGQFIMGPTPAMLKAGVPGFSFLTEAIVAAELVENELVITYAQNAAFPLLRYRTGDLFEVEPTWTMTYSEGVPILSWLGKGGVDVVRVHGVEVRAGTVDTFFNNLALPLDEYQVHLRAGDAPTSLRIEIEYVIPEGVVIDSMYLHEAFLDTFTLRPGEVVRATLASGFIESVAVRAVAQLSWQGTKRRVLINHVL